MMLTNTESNIKHAPHQHIQLCRSAPVPSLQTKIVTTKKKNKIKFIKKIEIDQKREETESKISTLAASADVDADNINKKIEIDQKREEIKSLSDMISFLQNKFNFPCGRELIAISKEFIKRFITPDLLENWILKECRLKLMWNTINPKNEISYGLVEFFNKNYYSHMRKNEFSNLEDKIKKIKKFHLDKTKMALCSQGEIKLKEIIKIQDKLMKNIVSCKEWRVYCERKHDNDLELLRARLLQLYNTFDSMRNQKIKDEESRSNLYN